MNLSLEQMNEIISNKESHIPPKLFKYREIKNDENIEENMHIDALKNEKTYLSNPYYFNDPYDSAFSIDTNIFKDNLIKTSEQKLKTELLKNIFGENNINPNTIKNKNMIYDNMNIDLSNAEDLIENNMHTFYEELVKQQINFKISCFSETQKSILMWSHYANQHQGFCIGYNTPIIKDKTLKKIYPVFYHETFFPQVHIANGMDNKEFNSLIKYKDWSYEYEWRLISNEKFLSLKPSEIYLGVRFNEDYIDYFKEIALEKSCKLFKLKMNYSKYALECDEIEL